MQFNARGLSSLSLSPPLLPERASFRPCLTHRAETALSPGLFVFFHANLKHLRFRHSLIQFCAVFFLSFLFRFVYALSLPCLFFFYTALSPRSFDHYACCGLSRSDPTTTLLRDSSYKAANLNNHDLHTNHFSQRPKAISSLHPYLRVPGSRLLCQTSSRSVIRCSPDLCSRSNFFLSAESSGLVHLNSRSDKKTAIKRSHNTTGYVIGPAASTTLSGASRWRPRAQTSLLRRRATSRRFQLPKFPTSPTRSALPALYPLI